ncbi:MAG: ROK family protein [Clostridia bacterium]|nr:ROK family protein [Clostridia bacterium]
MSGAILNIEERNLTRTDRVNVKESIVKIIIELLNKVIEEANVDLNDIEFIGIASPGTISDNKIVQATNLGLENFDLISELQKYINLPMQIKNDSKCAALAEKHYGSMRDYDDCVFICIGTGIGGAAFLNGEMLVPKRFSGFEFGHMVINKGGRQCTCGKRGCFETYASIRAFRNKIAEVLDIDNDFSGQYLREQLLDFNNEKVKEVVYQFIEDLSIGVCNLIDLFEPEIVVLGGSFSYYEGNPVYDRLLEKIKDKNSRFNKNAIPKIELAKLKNDAGIIGATIRI